MSALLLEPFGYSYMVNALWVSALVGGVCAFLSSYLVLKGWSLIGDALAHSVVPGVAVAYLLGLPFALGAFVAGGLAAGGILFVTARSRLKPDVIVGLIFTAFFGLGLFILSVRPIAVDVQTIIMGNLLAISPGDSLQLGVIGFFCLVILGFLWRDLMVVFFDEAHAHSIGLNPGMLRAVFFVLLSACVVAAMQTVGAFLVIALIVTPGASAYLLINTFPRMVIVSVIIGTVTGFSGTYLSYFVDGASGGIIVLLQCAVFVLAFLYASRRNMVRHIRQVTG